MSFYYLSPTLLTYTFKKMSEELNDNLSVNENATDGNEKNKLEAANTTENSEVKAVVESTKSTDEVISDDLETTAEKLDSNNELVPDTEVEAVIEKVETPEELVPDTEIEAPLSPTPTKIEIEDLVGEEIAETPEAKEEQIGIIELTDAQLADDSMVIEEESDVAMNAISNANAEESEDESIKGRYDIPQQDYEALPMEQLVEELEKLVTVEQLMSVKEHVEEVKKAFLSKYYHFIDEKKDEFKAENPESNEDFHYNFPLKTKFDTLYNQYRDKKNTHFKSLQNNLKANLENRMAIVEELKNLVSNSGGNISNSLKQLNDIRERWNTAGPIPKDKYNHV